MDSVFPFPTSLTTTNHMKPNIECIIFDLVGVLLEFRGHGRMAQLTGGRVGSDLFNSFWSDSKWALGFSQGTCSPAEFAQGAIGYFKLDTGTEEFIEEYKTWYVWPYSGAMELVCELKKRFRVGCLSNMNKLYVPRFLRELDLDQIMDDCVFSCEVGMLKPDSAIFRLAARRLDTEPGGYSFLMTARQTWMRRYRLAFPRCGLTSLRACGMP